MRGITAKFREIFRFRENFAKFREISRKLAHFRMIFFIFPKIQKCIFVSTLINSQGMLESNSSPDSK
jgi:hypothetical protein